MAGSGRRQRPLNVAGAEGDANLRSNLNWADLEAGGRAAEILLHWQTILVFGLFPDGAELLDEYSGARAIVRNGAVTLTTTTGLVLLSEA